MSTSYCLVSFKPLACKLVLCALQSFLYFIFVLAMALTLALPKNFKFCKIFSRPNPNTASTSQMTPIDIVVPSTLDNSVQSTTHVGESSDKRKSYEKNYGQFQLLWLPFSYGLSLSTRMKKQPRFKACSKICGKSTMLVANSDNLWKHQGRQIAKSMGHGVAIGENYTDHNSSHNQNEEFLNTIPIDSIQAQVDESMVGDRKKK